MMTPSHLIPPAGQFGNPPTTGIPCITQDPGEPAADMYLEICEGVAFTMATSVRCPVEETETLIPCGGHPICKPCFDLAVELGFVTGAVLE